MCITISLLLSSLFTTMAPVTTTDPIESPSLSIANINEAELRHIDDSSPIVTQIKVSLCYVGDLLAKDNGKWTPWI